MKRMRCSLATGSPREALTEHQLRRLLRARAVWDWIFTYDIRIETRVIPHSHPTLTLNTRYLDDDDRLLATFVHEQLHWSVQKLDDGLITQLAHHYPNLPIEPPHGVRVDVLQLSAPRHLLVRRPGVDRTPWSSTRPRNPAASRPLPPYLRHRDVRPRRSDRACSRSRRGAVETVRAAQRRIAETHDPHLMETGRNTFDQHICGTRRQKN
jgi:hypothetical protein